jgi:hypothetical protein
MYAGEIVLTDDHYVRVFDWLIVDGKQYRSQFYGKMSEVRKDINKKFKTDVKEIRWCNKTYRKISGY